MKRLIALAVATTLACPALAEAERSNAEIYNFALDRSVKDAALREALDSFKGTGGLTAWSKDFDLEHPLYSAVQVTEAASDECAPGPGKYVVIIFNSRQGKPWPHHMAFELKPNNQLHAIGWGGGSLMSEVIDDIRTGAMTCD